MNNIILVVAAHSDDEVLGCGGTIARHVARGDEVHVLYLADGVSSRAGVTESAIKHRMTATEKACEILGVSSTFFLDFPDNRLDSIPLIDVIKPIEVQLKRLAPSAVYTHHHGDLNVDHRIAHRAVMTACRPMPHSTVKQIFTFEVLSSTEWNSSDGGGFYPNWFVEIDDYLEKKIAAINAYSEEMREIPHSRSIEHVKVLARHRGYSVGVYAAEAFMLVRAVQ